jgi:hypothetical protein
VKFQLAPDITIRAGRSVAAPFLLSDTSLVGYTYPWVRLPPEVYGELPVSNQDGLAVNYQRHDGDVTQSLNVAYGQSKVRVMGGGEVSARKFLEASDALELGALTFRVGYTSLRATTDVPALDPLFAGFTQFGEMATSLGFIAAGLSASDLGAFYTTRESSAFAFSMATIGLSYDPGKWLVMTEWARTASDGLLTGSTAWYLMGGRRFGAFTTYLTVARVESSNNLSPGIDLAGLPPALIAAAITLNGGLTAALRNFATSQSSATAGLRWDVAKDIDLKIQYDRVRLEANSNGRLQNVQPGFRTGPDVNVVSLAMDFVF